MTIFFSSWRPSSLGAPDDKSSASSSRLRGGTESNSKPARGRLYRLVVLAAIPSPSVNGWHVGPFFFHAYGLAYVVAIVVAIVITRRRWAARGGDPGLVDEVALWAVPAGLIGGRVYFLATSWNEVPDHWWGPFAIWQGGLSIWGGIAGGTAAAIWVLRRRGADIAAALDAAAPALLVAQSIGRVGNYFNQELFGGPTSLPWALEIDPAHRPVGYTHDETFHPTFLYEVVWNLALAAILVRLGRRVRPPGLFALYVGGYSLGRIGEELLRVDPAHHIFGLRLNFFVAVLLTVVGFAWFARSQRASVSGSTLGGAAVVVIGSLICLTGCGDRPAPAAAALPHALLRTEAVLTGSARLMPGEDLRLSPNAGDDDAVSGSLGAEPPLPSALLRQIR